MKDVVIYGAGGLADEIEFILKRINENNNIFNFIGNIITDKNKYKLSDKIIGDENWLLNTKKISVIMGIGDPIARYKIGRRLFEKMSADKFPIIIDPTVIYDKSCFYEPGVVLAARTILTVNIVMKRFSFVNLNCTVGHGTVIGCGVVVNPGANISGNVNIGKASLVGTGAQILQNINIGYESVVGGGAVVTKDVNCGDVVVGIPAKKI